MVLRPWKKENPVLWARPTQVFHFGRNFFFFFSLIKSCKISRFGQSWRKFGWNILKISEKTFPKIKKKKKERKKKTTLDFCVEILAFWGVIFASRKKTNLKKCLNRPTLLGKSVRPQNRVPFLWPRPKGPTNLYFLGLIKIKSFQIGLTTYDMNNWLREFFTKITIRGIFTINFKQKLINCNSLMKHFKIKRAKFV